MIIGEGESNEVEGDELFSVIELECAQFRRRILCGRIDFREGR